MGEYCLEGVDLIKRGIDRLKMDAAPTGSCFPCSNTGWSAKREEGKSTVWDICIVCGNPAGKRRPTSTS